MAAIGDVDEANSALGLAIASLDDEQAVMIERLRRVQNELFDLGADLATPDGIEGALRIVPGQVEKVERAIDAINDDLSPLTSFILPGGSVAASALHLARATVRRAERSVVALAEAEAVNPFALAYINRLSDLLFVAARSVALAQGGEVLWQPGATREG